VSLFLLTDSPYITRLADREFAAALSSAGHDVEVESCPGADVAGASAFGHGLASRWRGARPDLVFAHGWLAGLAAQVATRDLDVPVVQRFGQLARRQDDPKRSRLEVALARGASLVLASCTDQAEQLATAGVPRRQVRVLPLGVDTHTFSDDGPEWRRTGRRRLVAADDLSSPETITTLLAMLAGLPVCELFVVGAGPAADPDQNDVVRILTAEAKRRGVDDRVHILGHLEDADLAGLLRSADLMIASAQDDAGVPVVLRAMSCGVPVVAADTGAVSDAVADGVTGLLVPPRSAGRLADAVRTLLSNGLARESYGLAATDRARARFSWDALTPAAGRVIDEVTTRHCGRRAVI